MNYFRAICLSATAGVGGCLYGSLIDKHQRKMMKGNPQEQNYDNTNGFLEKLYVLFKTQISSHFYKSVLELQCRNSILPLSETETCAHLKCKQPECREDQYNYLSEHYQNDENENSDDNDDPCKNFRESAAPTSLIIEVEEFPLTPPKLVIGTVLPTSCTRSWINIDGPDCYVYFDTRTRTPFWTVERMTCQNVTRFAHRHPEEFKFKFNFPQLFRFGNPENTAPFDIVSMQAPLKSQIITQDFNGKSYISEETVCNYCLYTWIWYTFHEYIVYLLHMYNEVFITTGLLYLNVPADAKRSGVVPKEMIPTHYFKVLTCKNANGLYRFECYKFRINDHFTERSNLKDYLVTREQLERDAGFNIFQNVSPSCVEENDTRTHPGFAYRRRR